MEPIDLAALRAEAEATDPAYPCEVAPEHLLALIDAVDAIETYRREYLASDDPMRRRRKIEKLIDALAPFDLDTSPDDP